MMNQFFSPPSVSDPPVTFQREDFMSWWRDAQDLLRVHWNEVAAYQDWWTLDVDVPLFLSLEKAGQLYCLTARTGDALIGYFVMVVKNHQHYRTVLVAVEDAKFVHPDYRGRVAIKFLKWVEQMARAAGARLIMQRSKAASGHGALYKKLGYDLMDEIFTKRLD